MIDPINKVLMTDATSLGYLACSRKAFYKLVLRRELAKPTPAPRFGEHVHTALAMRYRDMAFGRECDEKCQMDALEYAFNETPCPDEEWRNLGAAQKLIRAYNEKYKDEKLEVLRAESGPVIEMPFAVELPERPNGWRLVWIGRLDMAYRKEGKVFVRDHKTSSVLGPTYWLDAAVSEQQRGYCYALKRCLGIEPEGYEVNVLACRAPSKSGKEIEFARDTTYTKYPPGQLDEWLVHIVGQLRLLIHMIENDLWPMARRQCVAKFGACEYYELCKMPPEHRAEYLASSDFKTNDWTPLKNVRKT